MSRMGIALVISAPSGAGKSTLIQRLVKDFPHFAYSVSCTTRSPRPDELDGRDYHFISKDEFLARRENGFFAEWALVHDNYYGTPIAPVLKTLQEGRDLIFDIDIQGAAQLKESLAHAFFIFILPPTLQELEKRLRTRATDSETTIQKRLAAARHEIKAASLYDVMIINDDLDTAYEELKACYLAATLRPAENMSFLTTLLED